MEQRIFQEKLVAFKARVDAEIAKETWNRKLAAFKLVLSKRRKEASIFSGAYQAIKATRNPGLRKAFEQGRAIGEYTVNPANAERIRRLLNPVPVSKIQIQNFSPKETERIQDFLQGVKAIQNPGGLPIPNTVRTIRKAVSDIGAIHAPAGTFDPATGEAVLRFSRLHPQAWFPSAHLRVLGHEVAGHGQEGILGLSTRLPGLGIDTRSILKPHDHAGFSEFVADNNAIRALLERVKQDKGYVRRALDRIISEIRQYGAASPSKITARYTPDAMAAQVREIELARSDAAKEQAARYLGMQSFYSDIPKIRRYKSLLDAKIKRLDGSETKPTAVTQGGIPVVPDIMPQYEAFLKRLNEAGSMMRKDN